MHCSRLAFIVKIGQFASYSKFVNSNLKKVMSNMPKNNKHIAEMQSQRQKIKEKSTKYAPGMVNLQVLGSGAPGTPAALYLFTDQSRYLFNCGEGTQRLAHEHKMKLARLEHIFLTRRCWDRLGGLPGLALTVQDSGVPLLHLHGPPGMDELFAATRRFVVLRDLKIESANQDTAYEDAVMNVQYVPLKKSIAESKENSPKHQTGHCSRFDQAMNEDLISEELHKRDRSYSAPDDTDYYAHESKTKERNSKKKHKRRRSLSRGSGLRTEPPSIAPLLNSQYREETEVMSYICRLKPKLGTLSLEQCVEFGVPPGPLFGLLKSGNDITLPNGNVVKASEVRTPDDPGPIFIVLDIPNENYLDSLENCTEFLQHQSTATRDDDLATVVVHFTPPNVMRTDRYQAFIDKFSPSTTHLVLNEDNKFSGSVAIHRIQHQLNQISSKVFPLLNEPVPLDKSGSFSLKYASEKDVCTNSDATQLHLSRKNEISSPENAPKRRKTSENTYLESASHEEANIETDIVTENDNLYGQIKENLKSVDLKAQALLENGNTLCCFYLRPKKGLDRSLEPVISSEEYVAETHTVTGFTDSLKELKLILQTSNNTPRSYPRILFLGTGSCIPNKTRNTSSILIQTSECSTILLDCGEGTFGQIVRYFGTDGAKRVMQNLKAIYVSHLHADHHIGLIGVLQGRRRVLGPDVQPIILFAPKQIASWLHLYNKRFESIHMEYELIPNQDLIAESPETSYLTRMGLSDMRTCVVRHCPHAFGVALTTSNAEKITYSGDTMPCEELVVLGQDSHILIHEATMEDDLAQEARIKMHSTVSQAIEIGNTMNAKYILLTHFSQRYAKLPRIQQDMTINVGLAFDNMEVGFEDLPYLPQFYPSLKLMFTEHCDELEQRAARRAMKKQRQLSLSRENSPVRRTGNVNA